MDVSAQIQALVFPLPDFEGLPEIFDLGRRSARMTPGRPRDIWPENLSRSPSLAADNQGAWVGFTSCLGVQKFSFQLSPLSVGFPPYEVIISGVFLGIADGWMRPADSLLAIWTSTDILQNGLV